MCCKTQGTENLKLKTRGATYPKEKAYKVTGSIHGGNRDDCAFVVDNDGDELGVVDLKV